MMQHEKEQLLALLNQEDAWCQDAEARDASGDPVRYGDGNAVAWDISGALCHLFGWSRACELFGQLDRHLHEQSRGVSGQRRTALRSMAAIQDYNDCDSMTHETLIEFLQTMPVWRGRDHTALAS